MSDVHISDTAVNDYVEQLRDRYEIPIVGRVKMEKAREIVTDEMPFERTTFYRRFRQALDPMEMGQYRTVSIRELAREMLRFSRLGWPDPRAHREPAD